MDIDLEGEKLLVLDTISLNKIQCDLDPIFFIWSLDFLSLLN